MRVYDLPFPIATYSFGESRPSASAQLRPAPVRRRYTLRVAGMFASVSAVAILFGPTWTEAPVTSSATAPTDFLPQTAPEDATRAPPGAQILMNLDSFQTAGFSGPDPNHHLGSNPLGDAARSRAPHPRLTELSASMSPAPAVGAVLEGDPSMAADWRMAADDIGASSLPPHSIECGPSCSRDGAGKTGADSVDAGTARADLAVIAGATRLAVGARIEPELPSAGSLIAASTQKPLADIAERGVLLADAQGATAAGAVFEPVALEANAASTGNRIEAPSSVGVASAGSPQLGSVGQATLSASDTAEHSSVAADAPSTAAATIALHLDRVRKRYVGMATPEPLSDGPSAAVAEAIPAQGVGSPVVGLHAAESTPRVLVHDTELVAIQLGELISLFEARLDRPLFVWMRSSSAASKFVTAETLAAAGLKANYDPASKQLVLTVAEE